MLAPSPACSLNHNSAPGGIPYPDSIRLDTALAQQILRPARRFAAHIAIVNNPNRQADTSVSQRWKVHVVEPIVRPFLAEPLSAHLDLSMLTAYPLSKLLNKWRSDRLVGGRALGLPVGSQLCTRLNNRAPAQSQPAVVGAGAPYLVWIRRTSLPSTSTNILSYTVSQIIGSCGPPSAEMIAGTVLL